MANVIHAAAAAAAAAGTSTPDSVATADLSARPSDTCLGGSCAGTEKLCSEAGLTPPSTSTDPSPTLPEDDGTDAKYGAREEQSVQHKESAKKKRASKTAKQLKQSKLDIRREQFLAQVGLKAVPASHKQPAPNAKPPSSLETSPAPPPAASHHDISACPAPPSGPGLPGAGSRAGPDKDANGDAETEGTAAAAAAAITAVGRKNGVIAHASAVEASAVSGGNGLRAELPVGSVTSDGELQNTTAPRAAVAVVESSSKGGAGVSMPTKECEAKKSSRRGDGTAKKVPGNRTSVSSGPRDKQGPQDELHSAGSNAPIASGVPAAAALQSPNSPTEQPGASARKQQLQQCSAAGNGTPDAPVRANEDDREVVISGKKKNKRGSKAGAKAAEGKENGSSDASGTKLSVDEKQAVGQGVPERKGEDEGEAEDWEAVAEVLLELDEPKDRAKGSSAKISSSGKLGSDEAVKANGHHDGTNGTAGDDSAGSSDGEDASRPAALKHLHKRQQQEQLQQQQQQQQQQSLAPRQQQVKALHAATQTLLQKQQLLQQLQGKAADGDPILAPQRPRVQSSSGLDLYNVSRICSGGLRPEYTYTATVLSRSRSTNAHQDQRAWRPDDISRPPTLPPPMPPRMGLGSLGVSLANGLMAVGGGSGGWPSVTASDPLDGPWAHLNQHSQHHHHHHQFIHYRMQGESGTESPSGSEDSQPASFCPICAEELDTTDSSFVPCTCGFRLCLFCHHRIASEDGRCPGCRRSYSSSTMAAAAAAAVAAAAAPPTSSGNGQKVTKPTSMWLKF